MDVKRNVGNNGKIKVMMTLRTTGNLLFIP